MTKCHEKNMDNVTFHPCINDPEKAENHAKETFDWLQCAESWVKIFNNPKRALYCARKAEYCAEEYCEWHMRCEFWYAILPDKENEKKCVFNAESLVEDDSVHLGQHEYWSRVGGKKKARESLKKDEEWLKLYDQKRKSGVGPS